MTRLLIIVEQDGGTIRLVMIQVSQDLNRMHTDAQGLHISVNIEILLIDILIS